MMVLEGTTRQAAETMKRYLPYIATLAEQHPEAAKLLRVVEEEAERFIKKPTPEGREHLSTILGAAAGTLTRARR